MNVGIRGNSQVAFDYSSPQSIQSDALVNSITSQSIDSLLAGASQGSVLSIWRRLWLQTQGFSGHRAWIGVSLLSALFSMPILLSAYLGFAVEQLQYSLDWQLFNWLTMLTVVAVVFGLVAERHANALSARFNSMICQNLVSQIWSALLRFNSPVFASVAQSEIVSRLSDTIETIQKHQLFVLQQFLRSVFMLGVTLVVLLSHHYAFVLVVAFFVFVTCYIPIRIAQTADQDIADEPQQFARVNALFTSAIGQQLPLRFSDFSGITQHFAGLLQALAVTSAGKWLRWNVSFNTKVTLNLLSHIVLLGVGGQLYLSGGIGLPDLVVVYVLSSMVIPRLDNLYKIYNYLQSLRVGYAKFAELNQANYPTSASALSIPAEPISSIALDETGYSYQDLHQASESNKTAKIFTFNYRFEVGKSYFVTGASGSGKSTLINLLMGWLPASEGNVLINDKAVNQASLQACWPQFAVQEQSSLVLEQFSVLENIALFYGSREFESSSRFHRFVQRLNFADCLNKPVAALSGGERQKLALIRCLLKPAAVYIFDEVTASMDKNSEQHALQLILEISDAIVIFVSHHRYLAQQFSQVLELPAQEQNG